MWLPYAHCLCRWHRDARILDSPNFEKRSAQNFRTYWEGYLYPSGPKHAVSDAVYKLVRCGIAHNFASKSPFIITKNGSSQLSRRGGEVIIDALTFFDDLKDSYFRRFKPSTTHRMTQMQATLDALLNDNASIMSNYQAVLSALPLEVATQSQSVYTGSLGQTQTTTFVPSTSGLSPTQVLTTKGFK